MSYSKSYYYFSIFCGIFLIPSIFILLYFLYMMGIGRVLSYLLPVLISVLIFSFYFVAGTRILMNPGSKVNIALVQIALLAQTFQFDVLGMKFKNYYGPYLGIGFTDTPEFTWIFKFLPFDFLFGNGFGDGDKISLVINVFALLLFTIFTKLSDSVKPKYAETFWDVDKEP